MDDLLVKPGLRERKQERVRAELIEAGMRLFTQRGFDATTVDEVADAADVSRRTLFRYFETKADIVMAWTHGLSDLLVKALRARAKKERPLASLQAIFLAMSQQVAASPAETYAVAMMIDRTASLRPVSLQKHAEWEDVLTAVFVERLPKAADREQRARLLARMGVATFRTALDRWIATEGKADFAAILTETFGLLDRVSQM